MEDNTNLWNTKVSDLTVGDSIKVSLATPAVLLLGTILTGAVVGTVNAVTRKFRKGNDAPQNTTGE